MTTETARTLASAIAERLGVEPGPLEATFVDNPLAAAVALSMMGPGGGERTCDPASTVRFVAAMVGACAACLGEDETCRECHGKGTPGRYAPDAGALLAWISPSLRRLGLCVGRPRREPAGHTNGGGHG